MTPNIRLSPQNTQSPAIIPAYILDYAGMPQVYIMLKIMHIYNTA